MEITSEERTPAPQNPGRAHGAGIELGIAVGIIAIPGGVAAQSPACSNGTGRLVASSRPILLVQTSVMHSSISSRSAVSASSAA